MNCCAWGEKPFVKSWPNMLPCRKREVSLTQKNAVRDANSLKGYYSLTSSQCWSNISKHSVPECWQLCLQNINPCFYMTTQWWNRNADWCLNFVPLRCTIKSILGASVSRVPAFGNCHVHEAWSAWWCTHQLLSGPVQGAQLTRLAGHQVTQCPKWVLIYSWMTFSGIWKHQHVKLHTCDKGRHLRPLWVPRQGFF